MISASKFSGNLADVKTFGRIDQLSPEVLQARLDDALEKKNYWAAKSLLDASPARARWKGLAKLWGDEVSAIRREINSRA